MVSSWARLTWPMPWRFADDAERPSLMRVSWDSRFLNMRATAIFSASRSWRMRRAVDHGLHPLGELRAADVVVDELHFSARPRLAWRALWSSRASRAAPLRAAGGIEAHDPDVGLAHEGLAASS